MARPPLRLAVGLMSAGFFAMFFYDTLIPLLTQNLGHSERVFGAAIAAVGAGGVAGGAWMATFGVGRPFRRMGLGYLASGAVAGGGIPAAVFVALFACLGGSSAATVVPCRTVLQNESPPGTIGRVTALGEAASTTALLAAPFAGAALAPLAGAGAAFVAGGAGLLALAVAAWIRPSKNRIGFCKRWYVNRLGCRSRAVCRVQSSVRGRGLIMMFATDASMCTAASAARRPSRQP